FPRAPACAARSASTTSRWRSTPRTRASSTSAAPATARAREPTRDRPTAVRASSRPTWGCTPTPPPSRWRRPTRPSATRATPAVLAVPSLNHTGFNATQFQSLSLHPVDREFMLGGTQDNGTELKRSDATWTRADFGDGGFALIDQSATDTENVTMYHTYFNQT